MATKASLKQETTSVKKTMPDDEALYSFAQQKNFQCNELKFENIEKALKFYKDQRNEMLRYVHTSTENVRAHVGKTCIGNFDAYQLILLNTFFSKYYTQQIEKLKTDPNFPK